jgi:hypothetical protein
LPLISLENADILNLQNRAKDCVEREILSQIFMSSIVFITSRISIASTVLVLATYNIWFLPISVASVFPYFIARIIRGKEFYLLKKAQAKRPEDRFIYGDYFITNHQRNARYGFWRLSCEKVDGNAG